MNKSSPRILVSERLTAFGNSRRKKNHHYRLLRVLLICAGITSVFVTDGLCQQQTAQDYFQTGVEHLRASRFENALVSFRESERLDPKQASTKFNIGNALAGLRRFEEAESAFRKGLELAPKDVAGLTSLCRVLVVARRATDALAYCRLATEIDATSSETTAALIDAMFAARIPTDETQKVVVNALTRFANDQWILERAVVQAISTGNGSYAVELLNRLISVRPQSSFYVGLLASVYLELAREDEAIVAARKALELDPQNPHANYAMGRIFAELGVHDEAIVAFSKVLDRDPKMNDARFRRAVSLDTFGRRPEAISDMRTLLTYESNRPSYNFLLGRMLADTDEFREAVIFLKRASELDPNDFQAKAALGIALGSVPDYERSIATLEEALRMRPGHSVITMVLNAHRARQQSVPRIQEAIDDATANPKDVKLKVFVVQLLAYSGRIAEAEKYVKEIAVIAPTDMSASQAIAIAYIEAAQIEKALDLYLQQLRIREEPGTYLGLANIYQKRGRNEEAATAFAKVIELKPDSSGVMKMYADHLRNMGKRREALEMYKRSLSLVPTNAPALFQAGVLSLRFNDVDSARQYQETLKLVDPDLARRLATCIKYKLVLV